MANPERCSHGLLPGLCVVESCPNWDRAVTHFEQSQTRRTCIKCGKLLTRNKEWCSEHEPRDQSQRKNRKAVARRQRTRERIGQ